MSEVAGDWSGIREFYVWLSGKPGRRHYEAMQRIISLLEERGRDLHPYTSQQVLCLSPYESREAQRLRPFLTVDVAEGGGIEIVFWAKAGSSVRMKRRTDIDGAGAEIGRMVTLLRRSASS